MHAVAEPALESIPVDERHEELEVRFLPVVRGGRHQQEVAREARQQLPEAVTLGELDLAAEERGRHLVGFVAHNQVPAAIRRLQLVLDVFVASELVQARDDEVRLQKPVAGTSGFELVVGQNLERQLESPVQLVLPLLGETAGTDHQAALKIAAGDQLLDEQPGHDGLAGARVVRQQEAERLPRQHGFVHRGDLVRQRLDHRGVHGKHGVEQMREADALCLGDQAEQCTVAVEAPRPADLDDLQLRLVVTVQKLVGDLAGGRLVGQLERFGAEPLHTDDHREALGENAAYRGVGLEIFELHAFPAIFVAALMTDPRSAISRDTLVHSSESFSHPCVTTSPLRQVYTRAVIFVVGLRHYGVEIVVNATVIESALGTLRNLPTPVSSWRVEAGPDATEDPAVWVWAMLEHEEVDAGTRSRLRNIVRDRVRRETGDTYWVYVRFRGASETT